MRYILICFLFMGWAFYELSGGSSFDKEAVREARMAKLAMKEPTPVEPAPAVITVAPKIVVDTAPPKNADITPVSLNLTTLNTAAPTQKDLTDAVEAVVTEVKDEVADSVPQNVSIITSSADTPAIIPSLINPNEGVAQQPVETVSITGFDDIRTVSGDRVNVRGGPGTDFGVVGRLGRGDQVKVLQDDGIGWVRFETTDGSTAGWLADFLLNDS